MDNFAPHPVPQSDQDFEQFVCSACHNLRESLRELRLRTEPANGQKSQIEDQIRTMESAPPPIRVIAPGAAYRNEEINATHSAQFHQIEGLYVDENVSVADLKGALEFFMHELFGPGTEVEFRPHYFPFTEPSLEVYVKSKALKGGEQWIEVAGSGVVHPAVFEQVNKARGDKAYDPEKWSGYAFGLGMDRLAMILFDIPDLRLFAQNDLRFLRQFA